MSAGDFAQFGLRAELTAALEGAGYPRPSALQRASIPLVRRGGNVVLAGSGGSGALTGLLIGVLDRLASEADEGVLAIVVTPTSSRAQRIACAAARLAGSSGVRAAALLPGWRQDGSRVVVAPATLLLRAVQRSELKLDQVRAVILDRPSVADDDEDARNTLEAVLQVVPKEAQRLLLTPDLTAPVLRFADAHLRRAMHVPARFADEERDAPRTQPSPAGTLHYVVAGGDDRIDMLARLLVERESPQAVVVRHAAASGEVRNALALRGFGQVPIVVSDPRPEAATVIGLGPPLDEDALAAGFRTGDVFVIRPGELAHLRTLAEARGFTLAPVAPAQQEGEPLDAYRARIRRALDEEDLDAHGLVIEPLFAVRSPAEVAAALSALLRKRATPVEDRQARGASRASSPPERGVAGFVRLFLSVGQRDNVRAADVLGAIAGEAGIPGGDVGKIEIRDTFSVVEVPAGAAEKVIRALNGTTMRGRSLRVDFDRKGATPPRRTGGPPRSDGGARRIPAERRRRPRDDESQG